MTLILGLRAGLAAILLIGTVTAALAQQAPTPPPQPSPSPGGCERTPQPIV